MGRLLDSNNSMRLLCLCAALIQAASAASGGREWRVETPREGARIHSSFVVLSGTAPDGACARVFSTGAEIANVCAGEAGDPSAFQRILCLRPGENSIELRPEGQTAGPLSVAVMVEPPVVQSSAKVRWERMLPGDVLLSHSIGSEQSDLYNAVFTHAAIYYGPSADGVPLIAEAVTAEDAQGLGEVHTVPIEQSMAFRRGERVAICRPVASLSLRERRSLLDFLGGVVNRGLRYWSTAADFSYLYSAWMLWDPRDDRPRDEARFARIVQVMESRKLSTDRFTCATLVWRAYWSATEGRLDLASPNRAKIGGRLAGAFKPGFLQRVSPYYITPDSLYESGKLSEVVE